MKNPQHFDDDRKVFTDSTTLFSRSTPTITEIEGVHQGCVPSDLKIRDTGNGIRDGQKHGISLETGTGRDTERE
jgi:hypothetical protein